MEASVSSSSIDDDFTPEPRGRCYTWPMQHFLYDPAVAEHPPPVLPPHPPTPMLREPTVAQLLAATPSSSSSAMGTHLMPLGMSLPPGISATGQALLPPKKKRCRKKPSDQLAQKKPNPWGEESYSDLIAKALESAPDGRLKLNEIYQWFSDNIPYFRERSSQEEAAGWKNSIRHNLSLHSRFMRIQNEGAGKSSWWVINPDAKPGRNPRRVRASTLDTTSKATLSKKLKGARKRIHDIRAVGGLHSGVSSLAGSQASIMSHDIYGDDEAMQASFDPMFRPRTQSNLSVPGSSTRVSPSMEHPFDDFEFPSWVNDATAAASAAAATAAANAANHTGAAPIPTDILDRTDQMRIDSCRLMMNGVKQESKQVKTETPVVPPPSYLELSSVRNQSQLQNPLLRTQLASMKFPTSGLPLPYQTYSPWPTHTPLLPPSSCAAVAQANSVAAAAALPSDLESLTLPDQPLMDFEVESLLRHELSQTTDHRLNFDNL
ncbi:hypothetical protein RB195_004409 [Necator americanus]|uniref:Forkhead box protein O n=2 Tax=Necator americanus TaxID=51031 RepID=A0ABR1BLS8_NECAM